MKRTFCILFVALLLVSIMGTTFAYQKETVITYPKGRTNRTYGPSKYTVKTSTQQHWDICYYDSNRTVDTSVQVYLYDRELGNRGTHIETVTLADANHQFSWLDRSGKVGNQYKVVMKLNRTPDQGTYVFQWTP